MKKTIALSDFYVFIRLQFNAISGIGSDRSTN